MIRITTSNEWWSGTDGDVKVRICDAENNCCETDYLDNPDADRRWKQTDIYTNVTQLGQCAQVLTRPISKINGNLVGDRKGNTKNSHTP